MAMILLLFPHQLFADAAQRADTDQVILHKHPHFFTRYDFHVQKIALHTESMAQYAELLTQSGKKIRITDKPLGELAAALSASGVREITYYELTDHFLEREVKEAFEAFTIHRLPSPMFLTPRAEREHYFNGREKVAMADFYKMQRRRLGVLVTNDGKPFGEKWSFDAENRKSIPKDVVAPVGTLTYARTHREAKAQLLWFLENCLATFGTYEDAMRTTDGRLFHSVLTPSLNIGLITPQKVVAETLSFAEKNPIPLASLEGFLRQVIGWREFMHGTYEALGEKQRAGNFFNFTNTLPEAFWWAKTGLVPADTVISRVNEEGYCHHIERLMVLGNLLLLLEVRPDDVFMWFMTKFVDAYDWVMVPNIYGMSQYADGGMMTTKPYLCGSSYLQKMGDWPKGGWTAEWDALYWRFINRHRTFFLSNPRSSMMVSLYDRLKPETKELHAAAIRTLESRLSVSLPLEPLI